VSLLKSLPSLFMDVSWVSRDAFRVTHEAHDIILSFIIWWTIRTNDASCALFILTRYELKSCNCEMRNIEWYSVFILKLPQYSVLRCYSLRVDLRRLKILFMTVLNVRIDYEYRSFRVVKFVLNFFLHKEILVNFCAYHRVTQPW